MADDDGGGEDMSGLFDEAEMDVGGDRATTEVVPLRPAPPRLFTAVMVDETDEGITHAFGAVVMPDSASARASMRSRHGDRVAATADIREGFDASVPLVDALVSPAVADMLEQVARDPSSPIARGLEVAVVQRFAE